MLCSPEFINHKSLCSFPTIELDVALEKQGLYLRVESFVSGIKATASWDEGWLIWMRRRIRDT